MRIWRTALAKHMFPVLMSPRGRILTGEDAALGPVVRSARRSDFWLGDTGIGDGTSAAGTEKPMTDEVGRVLGLDADATAPVGGRRRDAHDFGGGFEEVDDVAATGALTSSQATVSTFGDCDSDLPLLGEAAAMDTDVLVDKGEPGIGVLGAVEHAGVVSVADEEGTSACSSEVRVDSFDSLSRGNSLAGEGKGDAGGVGSSIAYWMTSCGGRARGDIMIPGACEGS
jgi:hypothetical protein